MQLTSKVMNEEVESLLKTKYMAINSTLGEKLHKHYGQIDSHLLPSTLLILVSKETEAIG